MPEKVPTILRVDKREFTRIIMDISGYSEKEAENTIETFTLGIETWLEAMIRDVPEGGKVSLTFQGFGKWEVSFARKGKLSPWRETHGIPQPPRVVQLSFTPSIRIKRKMRERNDPIMRPYREEYNRARDRIREAFLQERESSQQKPDQYSTGLNEAYRITKQGNSTQSQGNSTQSPRPQPDHSSDISPNESGENTQNQDV